MKTNSPMSTHRLTSFFPDYQNRLHQVWETSQTARDVRHYVTRPQSDQENITREFSGELIAKKLKPQTFFGFSFLHP